MQHEDRLSRLETAARDRDLDVFEAVAVDIAELRDHIPAEQYFDLVERICDHLSSLDFGDRERQGRLRRQYLLRVLEDPSPKPLEFELRLLFLVVQDAPGGQGWPEMRKREAALVLRGLERLDDAVDPSFDPGDVPAANVAPPEGLTLSSGAAPEHIEDRELRAQYERALTEQREKADRYRRQTLLRRMAGEFRPVAEAFLVRAYSAPPLDVQELETLLAFHPMAAEAKRRILESVARPPTTER